MRINLTEAESFICRMLGVMRRSEAMQKVSNKHVGKDDNWSIDIEKFSQSDLNQLYFNNREISSYNSASYFDYTKSI